MADLFTLYGTIAIKAADAQQSIDSTMEKIVQLTGTIQSIGSESEKSMGQSSKFNTAAVWMGNMLSKLSEKAIQMGINLGKLGFGFNESMESYQYQFKALIGDADKATQLVADIQELAKVSPLGLEGLAKNAVMLLQSSVELSDIIPTLEMLGNLSLGNTDNMSSVVRAYTQILGKGGLMAQEMYQLGDAMVPIVEIMTKYGGERYADGSWYQEKMTDPTYKIPAEDMVKAFQAATAEGGKWHDYMLTIMDSFAGQKDRLGEEGKETLGAFFQPFFDMAKTDILPNLMTSLESFRTWITENKEMLNTMADAIGGLVSTGFDKMLSAFQWMMEHGEAVGSALGVIAVGLAAGAAAAHPYAAAILAVAAAIAWLASAEETPVSAFAEYTKEEIELLNQYHEAVKAAQQAREDYANADGFDKAALWDAQALADANVSDIFSKIMMRSNGNEMMRTYNDWFSSEENAMQLSIPVSVSEESEGSVQSEVAAWDLEGDASIFADPRSKGLLQSYLDSLNLTAKVKLQATGLSGLKGLIPGFATGLDRVPYDNMLAFLHKDEAVLTAAEAAVWRRGMNWNSSETTSRTRKTSASNDQPITVNLTVNGVSNSPYAIADEVKNALELLRWQG